MSTLELKMLSLFLFRDKTINNCYLFRYNVKLQTNESTAFCRELLNKTSWQWNNEPDVLIKKKNCYFYETTSALHAILYLVVKFLSVTKPILIRPFFCARSLVHWKTSFWTVQLDRDNQRGWCVPHILTVMQKIKVSTNYNRNMNFKLTKNKKYLIY